MHNHPLKHERQNPMTTHAPRRFAANPIAEPTISSLLPAASATPLFFACSADNDLFRVASENGIVAKRFDTPQSAVEAAGEGDGVLLLADGYPEKTTALDAALHGRRRPNL